MPSILRSAPLAADLFAPYGDVLDTATSPDRLINEGRCARFHDRARLDFGPDGRAGISVFDAQPLSLPHRFDFVERHPDGSQAFLPLFGVPFLVIVAPDEGGQPGPPQAFVARAGQGVNLLRGVWHGVLTPLAGPGVFAVVDRIGPGANLETFRYPQPFTVV
jgi:ureidoglycolate lyase